MAYFGRQCVQRVIAHRKTNERNCFLAQSLFWWQYVQLKWFKMVLGDEIAHCLFPKKCSYKRFYHALLIRERIGKGTNLHNYAGWNRVSVCVQPYLAIIKECLLPILWPLWYVGKACIFHQPNCYFFHQVRQKPLNLIATHLITEDCKINIFRKSVNKVVGFRKRSSTLKHNLRSISAFWQRT